MLPTTELCEGCQKEYHKAHITDDGVRLCDGCYIELLKSELSKFTAKNAILNKYLKHARDDKEIRVKEIEVLEAKVDKLKAGKNRLFERARDLEDALRDQGFHAQKQCHHGMTHYVGDHCKYDLKILNEHTPWDSEDDKPNENPQT